MIKFRLYFDKDAETEWLNQMSEAGWEMEWFFAGFYGFKECEKGKYIYQVDFKDNFFSVSREYKEFMQDMDVEIVQNWGFWVILRKLASAGKFELYTDVDSSVEHYSKIRGMFIGAAIIEVIMMCMELYVGLTGYNVGYIFALLIGLLLFAFVNIINKTNRIIEELKERKMGGE